MRTLADKGGRQVLDPLPLLADISCEQPLRKVKPEPIILLFRKKFTVTYGNFNIFVYDQTFKMLLYFSTLVYGTIIR